MVGSRTAALVSPDRLALARDMTPPMVRPSSMSISGPSFMTATALAATFQGIAAAPAHQPIMEVLPPVTYRPAHVSAGSLPGSYTAPPMAPGLQGSYVAPPKAVSVVLPPPISIAGKVSAGSVSYEGMPNKSPSFVPPTAMTPLAAAPRSFSMQVLPPAPLQHLQPAPGVTPAQARDQVMQLTSGVPLPDEIDKQKVAYSKRLDGQLKYEEELLKMTQQQQTQFIYQAAEAQKRQACLAIEQQARQQELQLQQQTTAQMMGMQQELQSWKLLLERQASELTMEYQTRKNQEELMLAQIDAQQNTYMMQARLAGQLQNMDRSRPGADEQYPQAERL